MKNQPKTIVDLDALQASLNPAHLDRLPRPHALLTADIADRFAREMRYLADDLAEQANLWRVVDLTASDAADADLLAKRAYDAAWLDLCSLPLEALALACAYSVGSYPGSRRILRDCAVDAVRALRDKLAKYPHRRRDYCDIRDDADHAVRHAVRAMVDAATSGETRHEGGAE